MMMMQKALVPNKSGVAVPLNSLEMDHRPAGHRRRAAMKAS
jgi:hypothetical protein